MKIIKIIFSAFLLVVLGFVFTTSTQAKLGPTIYAITYHYHYFSSDINSIKPSDNIDTIRVPKISDIVNLDSKSKK